MHAIVDDSEVYELSKLCLWLLQRNTRGLKRSEQANRLTGIACALLVESGLTKIPSQPHHKTAGNHKGSDCKTRKLKNLNFKTTS